MAGRSKGSKVSKVPGSEAPIKPDTVVLKLTVSRETARVLRLEAFGRDCSLGQVVADLLRSSPRRFVLTERSRGSAGPVEPLDPVVPGLSLVCGESGPEGLLSDTG